MNRDQEVVTASDGLAYIESIAPGEGRRSPARARLSSDAPTIALDGQWRFRWSATALPVGEAPDAVGDPDFDDSTWDEMTVPSHWVLQPDGRYGRPIYTNTRYPFPLDPPHVPDQNPTGVYRRTFMVPDDAEWSQAERILLRFDGVESVYKVWLNGQAIGVGRGSRLVQEFDISAVVRPGENLITVRVHQWSAGSYVEDQDQWWLPGIFRDVTVLARPRGGIDDLWLRAWFDDGRGRIDPELNAADEAFPVYLKIAELGVEVTWESAADVAGLDVGPVAAWSAESPTLYDVEVSSCSETVRLRLGFRTVEIVGDQFLVNGRRVVFHGMNRHEIHPQLGRVFDLEFVRSDLILMKQFNVNAIRTSHYPPHPGVLDLADELGFWVIDECDLETHGFEPSGWRDNPSDDPAWQPAYLDRMRRTLERDKNHACVILWSLGNEAGTGQNLAAMAQWVHWRDPGRPVHYEGDHVGAYTDVYSRMYPPVPEVEVIGSDTLPGLLPGCDAAQSIRLRSKPFLLCEYAHAMGNGPGAMDQYEDLVWRYRRLHGGFVWEWRDHGLAAETAAGQPFFAYGGDFGEVLHDGNYCMDGMVLSDGRPMPSLHEFKAVAAPIRFTWESGAAGPGVRLTNRFHSLTTAGLVLAWNLAHDGEVVAEGRLETEPVRPGESRWLALPAQALEVSTAGETWLTVSAAWSDQTAWAPAGHEVAVWQHDLTAARSAGPSGAPLAAQTRLVAQRPVVRGWRASTKIGPAQFDGPDLTSLAGLAARGPRLQLGRAPTGNDRRADGGSYVGIDPRTDFGRGVKAPADAEQWLTWGLDRLEHRIERVEEASSGAPSLTVVTRSAPAASRESVTTVVRWTAIPGADAVDLAVSIIPSAGWKSPWPRIGVRFELSESIMAATWFGTGPHESYPDSRQAALVGRYTSAIDDLAVPYARPQENGHRSDLRELTLIGVDGPWLRIAAEPDNRGRRPGFTLSRHTAEQLAAAEHLHELPPSDRVWLYLDAAQHGLGSRACGPDVWPDFALSPDSRTLHLILMGLDTA